MHGGRNNEITPVSTTSHNGIQKYAHSSDFFYRSQTQLLLMKFQSNFSIVDFKCNFSFNDVHLRRIERYIYPFILFRYNQIVDKCIVNYLLLFIYQCTNQFHIKSCHVISAIMLKVALNTRIRTPYMKSVDITQKRPFSEIHVYFF